MRSLGRNQGWSWHLPHGEDRLWDPDRERAGMVAHPHELRVPTPSSILHFNHAMVPCSSYCAVGAEHDAGTRVDKIREQDGATA